MKRRQLQVWISNSSCRISEGSTYPYGKIYNGTKAARLHICRYKRGRYFVHCPPESPGAISYSQLNSLVRPILPKHRYYPRWRNSSLETTYGLRPSVVITSTRSVIKMRFSFNLIAAAALLLSSTAFAAYEVCTTFRDCPGTKLICDILARPRRDYCASWTRFGARGSGWDDGVRAPCYAGWAQPPRRVSRMFQPIVSL